jgi:hypothetical protein
MDLTLHPIADLCDGERADLAALSRAVYPPEVAANWPGRHLEWAAPEFGVFVRADGELVAYVGIVLRSAFHDGRPVRVGGIGGVKTHPAVRRRGFAAAGLRRAVEFFREQPDIGFGVLVCSPDLLGYYGRLGWEEFTGRLLVAQRGVPAEFTFNRVMVCPVREAAPATGTIDLAGTPW